MKFAKITLLTFSTVLFFTANLARATEAPEEPLFHAEPWYLSNPISRLARDYTRTIYSLVRLDRLATGEYLAELGDAAADAVGHTFSLLGDSATDLTRAIIRLKANARDFRPVPSVLQCTSWLPVPHGGRIAGALTQMRHAWIQIGDRSYGMPFTIKETYFGGEAVISSPDPFLEQDRTEGVICSPILRPGDVDEKTFESGLSCIAEKLTLGEDFENTSSLRLNYNALTNNCAAVTHYLARCAGGLATQRPNAGIGSSVKWEKEILQVSRDAELTTPIENTVRIIDTAWAPLMADENATVTPSEFAALTSELQQATRVIGDIKVRKGFEKDGAKLVRYILTVEKKFLSTEETRRRAYVLSFLRQLKKEVLLDHQSTEPATYLSACEMAREECNVTAPIQGAPTNSIGTVPEKQ